VNQRDRCRGKSEQRKRREQGGKTKINRRFGLVSRHVKTGKTLAVFPNFVWVLYVLSEIKKYLRELFGIESLTLLITGSFANHYTTILC
jgi:hypothetical protein